ncbi:MAG: MoaD/ThiS family protein [Thermoguttaceae bacterium]|nr:MoaD/ThiS family protein [Thermoguttaceae bacterium]MDW8037606.1 MoaD/ThiS family protein [Thermoguttaceae bacterium]
MAWVQIPMMLAEFTGGVRRLEATGANLRELIEELDRRFPGIAGQIYQGEKIRPTLVVTVDGKIATDGLNTPVASTSEVCFLPFLGGG